MPGTQQFGETFPYNVAFHWFVADGVLSYNYSPANPMGSRIDILVAYNNDGVDHTLTVELFTNAGQALVGIVDVPAGSGVHPTPPVDVLAALFPASQQGLALWITDVLQFTNDAGVSSDGALAVSALGGGF